MAAVSGVEDAVLRGKVAVVTGAARGIGRAVCARMSDAGASVVMVDLSTEVVTAASELCGQGGSAVAVRADVSSPEGNAEAVQRAVSTFGRVDVFHANAGIAPAGDLVQLERSALDRTIAVNLTGAIHGCRAVLPTMVAQRSGVILLTASIAAFVGDPTVPVYGATKGGLTALCRSIAVRHGPDGIRCVTICPGDVGTRMLDDHLALQPDASAARVALNSAYPLGRLIDPDEIGHLAVFLASDRARSITGTDIVVDAGLTARCY